MKRGHLGILTIVISFLSLELFGDYQPREGDIIFQSLPKMDLVLAIEGCTESKFSHCGVVIKDNVRENRFPGKGCMRSCA